MDGYRLHYAAISALEMASPEQVAIGDGDITHPERLMSSKSTQTAVTVPGYSDSLVVISPKFQVQSNEYRSKSPQGTDATEKGTRVSYTMGEIIHNGGRNGTSVQYSDTTPSITPIRSNKSTKDPLPTECEHLRFFSPGLSPIQIDPNSTAKKASTDKKNSKEDENSPEDFAERFERESPSPPPVGAMLYNDAPGDKLGAISNRNTSPDTIRKMASNLVASDKNYSSSARRSRADQEYPITSERLQQGEQADREIQRHVYDTEDRNNFPYYDDAETSVRNGNRDREKYRPLDSRGDDGLSDSRVKNENDYRDEVAVNLSSSFYTMSLLPDDSTIASLRDRDGDNTPQRDNTTGNDNRGSLNQYMPAVSASSATPVLYSIVIDERGRHVLVPVDISFPQTSYTNSTQRTTTTLPPQGNQPGIEQKGSQGEGEGDQHRQQQNRQQQRDYRGYEYEKEGANHALSNDSTYSTPLQSQSQNRHQQKYQQQQQHQNQQQQQQQGQGQRIHTVRFADSSPPAKIPTRATDTATAAKSTATATAAAMDSDYDNYSVDSTPLHYRVRPEAEDDYKDFTYRNYWAQTQTHTYPSRRRRSTGSYFSQSYPPPAATGGGLGYHDDVLNAYPLYHDVSSRLVEPYDNISGSSGDFDVGGIGAYGVGSGSGNRPFIQRDIHSDRYFTSSSEAAAFASSSHRSRRQVLQPMEPFAVPLLAPAVSPSSLRTTQYWSHRIKNRGYMSVLNKSKSLFF